MEIVLNNYGGFLSRSNSNFLVSNDESSQLIPVYGVTTIYAWKSTRISTDAIILALDNDIDIVFMDRHGNVKGRIWNNKFGSIATIRKGQLLFETSQEGVVWIKDTIIRKIKGQLAVLSNYKLKVIKDNDEKRIRRFSFAEQKMHQAINQIKNLKALKVTNIACALRGLEGMSSKLYFQALATITKKELMFSKRRQRPAKDVINAMLNYGYAILYNRVDNALVKAGIDPAIGLFHVDNYSQPVFTYDVIEPYRWWIDEIVFNIAVEDYIRTDMCEYSENGNDIWLGDELRKTLSINIIEALSESNGDSHGWSREAAIQMDAQKLARTFKQLYKKNRE